jgi:putative transposase
LYAALGGLPTPQKVAFLLRATGLFRARRWPSAAEISKQAKTLAERYGETYPKAIEVLENGLEDSLIFFDFPSLDSRKISSNNMIERLNKEIRRRTRVIGIFPNPESYVRLVTIYLMEYSEDWSVSRSYLSEQSIAEIPQLAA